MTYREIIKDSRQSGTTFQITVFILLVAILVLTTSFALAGDLDPHYKFSGVKAPDSPYKNTWGAFQTDLFSGSFSYDYKIEVPPGTNGLAPHLSISYNSHSAKGKTGWVGAGWEIPLSYVQRNINYTRKDTSDDKFELYLDGAKHDLIFVGTPPADLSATPYIGLYKTKNETYLRIEFKSGATNTKGNYWLVTAKDGTQYRFGYNLDSETLVKATDATVPKFIWRWGLDQLKDTNSNGIYFSYFKDQGSVYLDTITYNNDGKRTIQFVREAKPDAYLMIEQGSEVYDAYRLSEIQVKLNGALVRKYKLSYVMNEIGDKSLLSSITLYGDDGATALPPEKFSYTMLTGGFNEAVQWDTPGTSTDRMDIRTINADSNDIYGDTFDVNGDGLPDIVRFQKTLAVHDNWQVWLNTGSGFANEIDWAIPKGWTIRNFDTKTPDHAPHTKTSPMDFNGDGYVDFLQADGGGDYQLKIVGNNGSSFSGGTCTWGSPCIWTMPIDGYIRDLVNPYDGSDPNVKQIFIDMNGDGLPDIVHRDPNTTSHWHIYRNTGNGFAGDEVWTVYQANGWIEDFSTSGSVVNTQTGLYDVNGDGLPDFVDAHTSVWQVYINTGSDFLPAVAWNTQDSSYNNINDTDSTGRIKRDFIDINGDGLPDIVDPSSGQSTWSVRYNTGHGFTSAQSWTVPSDVTPNGFLNNVDSNGDSDRAVFDIDGDGAVDLIREFSGYWNVYTNKSAQADILQQVTDKLGGIVTVSYNSSAKYANTRLPFNYWVVNSVTTNNGMTGPHALTSTTGYSYAQGLYDFPSKEFRGFGKVIETKADRSKAIHYYYQDEVKKGKEYWSEVDDAAYALYAGTWNNWDCQQLYPVSPTCTTTGDLSKIVYASNLTQTDSYTYDGVTDGPKIASKQYQNYDAYGNAQLSIDYGDLDVLGDETYTYNYYAPNTQLWIVNKVNETCVLAHLGGQAGEPCLRQSWFWYDDNPNPSTPPVKGNLTIEKHYLNTGSMPVTYYEYDPYGNRTKVTDPEGRVTQTTYDSSYNTFPVQVTNAKNQTISKTYDPGSGQVLSVTDPNSYVTTYGFDTFRRKIREVKPYDSDTSPTVAIQYVMDGIPPESVITYRKDGTPTYDTLQSIDGFGNLIQTKAEYESDMNKVAVDVFYDEMGRVKRQSNPYLTDSTLAYSIPELTAPGTSYGYDPVGRPTLIINPDNTTRQRSFFHWGVWETDENSHQKYYLFDASQRLLRVNEQLTTGGQYITQYTYSPLGELKQIQDHNGNLTTIEYDALGRKTKMVDPDMGTWIYGYDRVGNLTAQTDAKGVTTNIQYDPLNRKTLVDYPNSPDIQLTYDTNTIGTLAQVVDAAGSVNYKYDQRLRKVQEDRTMDSLTWTTKWNYDSMDRVSSMTYPDSQTVVFNYNSQAKLDNIPSIISGMHYNANGQVTQKTCTNGKSTAYSYYELNQRLNKIMTGGLQDFTYAYDNVGNISSIIDAAVGRTENFTYDDLDRLATAGDSGYSSQYQYNAIGNMTSMTKDGKMTTYSYGTSTAQPHAVKGVNSPMPVVGSFVINNGNAFTTTNLVTLNNVSIGPPTYYMASENKSFAGASWKPYSAAPTFLLSGGFGAKTIYFKVKNADGESTIKSDTISFRLDPASAYIDTDGDGLSDFFEYMIGTDATKRDTDGDGLSDYAELLRGTDPRKMDSDNDGINDPQDPYPNNPNQNSFSENNGMRFQLNEGGNNRGSTSVKVSDSMGNAFGGTFSVSLQSHPLTSVSPPFVAFDAVDIGASKSFELTITNVGIGDLKLNSATITGDSNSDFSKLNDACSGNIIKPSFSCKISVSFLPGTAEAREAYLHILSNDPIKPEIDVLLTGAGILDTTPPNLPLVSCTTPTNDTTPTWSWVSGGNGGNGTFRYKLDNSNLTTGATTTTATTYTPESALAEGPHTLYVQERDAASNWSLSGSKAIVIDLTSPVSKITSPANNSSLINPTFKVTGTASDVGSSVVKVEVSCNGGANWAQANGTTNWSYTCNFGASGTFTIQSRATDEAGNMQATPASAIVTVYQRTPNTVTTSGRTLKVNGTVFTVKGVIYTPTPIGEDIQNAPYGDYFTTAYSGIYTRDLPLIRNMGANTIRLKDWDPMEDHVEFLDVAWNSGVNPVYAIAGYHINAGMDLDPLSLTNVRETVKAEFREMVAVHKNHPAILMWAIGDDLNGSYSGDMVNLMSLANELAGEAHAEDGNHPVVMPLEDINLNSTITTYNGGMSNLDLWGINAYRGNTFGTLFTDYQARSTKPLLMTGYGIDAYNDTSMAEDQATQATYAGALWGDIMANSTTVVGGVYKEYSDQWWAGRQSVDTGCPEADNSNAHGDCGTAASLFPDGYDNFEWWGLMRISDNGSNPDTMTQRLAYSALKGYFTTANAPIVTATTPTKDTTPTWTWISGGGGNGTFRYRLDNPVLTTGATTTTLKSCTSYTALSNGSHTLYVQEKNAAGLWSATGSKTVLIDTIAPVNGTVTATPGNTQVTLNWTGFTDTGSDIGGYKLRYATGSAPTSCTTGTAAPGYDGTSKTYTHTGLVNGTTYGYRVCAIDKAGNTSIGATAKGKPVPETNPPAGTIAINGGAAATNKTTVALALTANDDGSGTIQMCISNSTTCTTFAAFAPTKSWILTTGAGTKTVRVWYRDQWGNTTSTPYSASIILDTTAPTNGTVTATPGNTQVTLNWTGFTDTGSDIGGYKLRYATGSAPTSCTTGIAAPGYDGTSKTYTHTGLVNGTTYGYRVCAIDKAGNTSTGATKSAKPL